MPIFLRQSTASQEIPLGYFLDSTDGDTAETGLTIANTDIKIWKTGATTLASKNSGGATHIAGGVYYCTLDATDTDTIGPLVIFVHVSGALSVRVECCVLDENVYDVWFGTTAPSTYAGGAVASVTGSVGSISGVTFPTNFADLSITATTGRVDIDSVAGTSQTAGDVVALINTVDSNVDAILLDTGTDGVLLAATATSAQLVDDVWDEVITGAAHNVATSAAKFLREASSAVAGLSGTAQSGTASTITLASGAVTANDILNGERITIIGGTGVGQSRLIIDSAITTDVVTVAQNWITNPSSDSEYVITGAEVDIRGIQGVVATVDNFADFFDGTGYDATANSMNVTQIEGGDATDQIRDSLVDDATRFSGADVASILSLLDDARTEPGQGAPPVNPDLATKIDYLYKAWRNKSDQTATTFQLYDDAGTTVDQKATVSDDATTATKGEVVSGP